MSQTKAQLLDNIKDNVQLDAQKALRFADSDSSHYVAFRAPGTVSSSVTWTLPAADGSANYVLATDGSGTLSWIADPAGQWVTSGSNIYFTAGNVGIGDNSPSNPLSVTGASAFNGDVQFTGASYNALWDKSANALEFADNSKAIFGSSEDLQIYFDGSNSRVRESGTGNLRLEGGVVELWGDGSKQLNTFANGIQVTGISSTGGIDVAADNAKIRIGASQDLEIYHDASNSRIHNATGELIFRTATNYVFYNSDGTEKHAKFNNNGAVELYYDNVNVAKTIAGGLYIERVGGGGSSTLQINGAEGQNSEIYMYADEGDDNADKWLHIASTDGSYYLKNYAGGSWETSIKAVGDGATELYYNNAKTVETTVNALHLTGNVSECNIKLMTSDGTQRGLIGSTNGGEMYCSNQASEKIWDCDNNGEFACYHDNTKRFQTLSNGARIFGNADIYLYLQASASTGDTGLIFEDSGGNDDGSLRFDTDDHYFQWGIGGSDIIRFGTTGDVMVGTTTNTTSSTEAGTVLYAHGGITVRRNGNMSYWKTIDTGGYNTHVFLSANTTVGTIVASSGGTAYNTTSDYRLKENQVAISDGITRLKTLKPYRFNFKNNPSKTVDGFFAHEVSSLVPEAITGTKDAVAAEDDDEAGTKKGDPVYQQIDQAKLVPLLTAALKEAITKIETLETKVAALEAA